MVWSPTPRSEGGYATPAALVVSLALAMMATAAVARSTALLRQSRADLDRSLVEYAFDGAQLTAAAEVVRSGVGGPYRWTFTSELGFIDAIAEPEGDKLSLGAAARLDLETWSAFGIEDAEGFAQAIAVAATAPGEPDIPGLSPTRLWRDCGPSLVAMSGGQDTFTYAPRTEPGPGENPPSWRVGELWRIRLTATSGWRDDRIVRFTGDAHHPIAVVARRVSRGEGEGAECEAILRTMAGA